MSTPIDILRTAARRPPVLLHRGGRDGLGTVAASLLLSAPMIFSASSQAGMIPPPDSRSATKPRAALGPLGIRISVALTAIADLVVTPARVPQRCATLLVAAARMLRRADIWMRIAALCLFWVGVLCVRAAAATLAVSAGAVMTPLAGLFVLAAATGLLWGSRAQLVAVAIVGLSVLCNPCLAAAHPGVAIVVAAAAWSAACQCLRRPRAGRAAA